MYSRTVFQTDAFRAWGLALLSLSLSEKGKLRWPLSMCAEPSPWGIGSVILKWLRKGLGVPSRSRTSRFPEALSQCSLMHWGEHRIVDRLGPIQILALPLNCSATSGKPGILSELFCKNGDRTHHVLRNACGQVCLVAGKR